MRRRVLLPWLGRRIRGLWLLWLIAAGAVAVGLILWAAVAEPSWLLPDTRGLSPAERVRAQTDLRNTLVTMLGGLAVLVGAAVGAANLVATQRVQWRAQVTERFSKAIEQLGQRGDDKLDVRIGAVYALEQIARDSAELHWPIMEVFTAYLREHTAMRPAEDFDEAPAAAPAGPPPADLQAIATVIGRRRRSQDAAGQRLDLHQVDLRRVQWTKAHLERAHLEEAHLKEANLEGADLNWAHLEGANLEEAHLEGTELIAAHLEEAHLERAHLEGAGLEDANLEEASLYGANLEEASLYGAHLEGAILREAHLERAHLWKAHLEGADLGEAHLEGANLEGVDLTGVQGLSWAQVRLARRWDRERLPAEVREEADREAAAAGEPGPSPG